MCLYVCVSACVFPAWVCRFGVKEDATRLLCVIFNRADDLMCLYVVDPLVSLCHLSGVCDAWG